MHALIQMIYCLTTLVLILGLRQMSSPKTAHQGIIWAGFAMLATVLVTLLTPGLHHVKNDLFLIVALGLGTVIAVYSGKIVKMIHMPQMIALYNGMGGGAAAAIGALELLHDAPFQAHLMALVGAIVGAISFSGSLMAFAKLQELLKRPFSLPKHNLIYLGLVLGLVIFAILILSMPGHPAYFIPFFVLLLALGVHFTAPIGGANMPVVISLFNAMTGLAVAFNGFALENPALVVAGTVVGASGTLLTQLMAKAMHQSLSHILLVSPTQSSGAQGKSELTPKTMEISDAAIALAYAKNVIIAPGYGMAVAQAQHKIQELTQRLIDKGVHVKFAIHPVAGRMPGHMNVLLAEAGIPYELISDLEEINPEFPSADVALVIGANDVVNPAAHTQSNSPIYGMPVLDVALAKQVFVIKRGQGYGFSGVENTLFTQDNVHMLYGDGQSVIHNLIQAMRELT